MPGLRVMLAVLCASGCGSAVGRTAATGPVATADDTTEQGESSYCDEDDTAARFTCDVAARIRSRVDGLVVRERSAFTILIETDDGDSILQANLDNLWHGCQTRPDDCDRAKDYYASLAAETLSQLDAPDPPTRDNVRAVLKHQSWVAELRAQNPGRPQSDVITRPFVADIVILYVVDMPNSMRGLTRGDLTELGLDEDDLYEVALQNLTAALEGIPRSPIQQDSTIGVVQAGDSYEASRLLLHARWREVADEVEGELLVAVPSRDVVLYVGAGRVDDVVSLRALAAEMAEREPYPVSAVLLRWTPEGWEPHAP